MTALGVLALATPVLARGDDTPTDFQVALKAAAGNELDYERLRQNLFKRYTPLVEQMEQAESSYISVFSDNSGESTIGAGAIPGKYVPWCKTRSTGS